MKKLFAFLFAGMLSASMLSASEVQAQQGISGLQSQELEFLFGANADAKDLNIAVLSEKEMKEIKGEFWVALGWAALFSGIQYGGCRIFNGKDCDFKFEIDLMP